MTIGHARIVKGAFTAGATGATGQAGAALESRARRLSGAVLAAKEEAESILARAKADAAALAARSAADAAAKAREEETARLAAGFLALRAAEEKRAERDTGRVVDLAVLLAERLLGESLRVEPARIAELAEAALAEARGARRVRVQAAHEDAALLRELLGEIAEVEVDPALGRGSLVVHTELGLVDARLKPQLDRLAAALREALA